MPSHLLLPYDNFGLKTKNRITMSAMTRGFADAQHHATDQMRDYYVKRASAGTGLILTEGVVIDVSADGYNNVPHIANPEQAQSWKAITETVQSHGTKIFCQLWHCGRISHSDYTGGNPPVSSTTVPAEGINRQNNKPFGTPVALDEKGIKEVHDYYLRATELSLNAGFDGIQLHLGHGYLADQFFDARINDRTDKYGGSVENRCRFALELVEKIFSKFPSDKVMIRISPSRDMGSIYDWPDLDQMLNYLIPSFWKLGVRLLDVSCARADYYQTSGRIIRKVRPMWKGCLLGGASLTAEQAEAEISEGLLDLVTWGRTFIANPDLPEKIRAHTPWQPFDVAMLRSLN
ncbi:MAG: hypothetical protein K2X47_18910 [Bdellovibrionales bacterium]|nr:hypothetical protein [Bdellovibrionales bacterium]